MVVGELAGGDDLRPDPAQSAVEFLRAGYAGEGDNLAADQGRRGERVGLETRADERLARGERGGPPPPPVAPAQNDQPPHEGQRALNGRAQRTSRYAEPIAEAGLAVHHGEGKL